MKTDAPQLDRGLGVLETITLLVGGIIGTSIFVVPAAVAREVGAPGLAFMVWLLSGLMAACGALCYAELGAAIPQAGGTYVFLKRAYGGSPVAFLFAWTMFFVTAPGAIAIVSVMVASYAGHFLSRVMPYGNAAARAVAVAVILALTVVNYLGVRTGARTQNVLTFIKTALIVAPIVLCLWFGNGDFHRFSPLFPADRGLTQNIAAVLAAMIMSQFSFSGWYFASHVAEEIREPARTIPLALLVSMTIITVIYLSLNFVYIYTLPFDQLQSSGRVGADAMQAALGAGGANLLALAVIVSALGSMNAQVLNYPRIVFALARDGMFFRPLSEVHPVRRTPAMAILLQGCLACLYALTGTYQQILTWISFVSALFLALAVAAVIVLRFREPELPRPYRTFGYPLTPCLYLLISGTYLVNLLLNRLSMALVGIAITLIGLPFWFYWRRTNKPAVQGAIQFEAALKE